MNNVRAHYDRLAGEEWERLVQDAYHGLELRAALACLEDHLPATGHILDVGGGPGRYARELCRRGYTVTLLDLSEGCASLAREKLAAEPPEVAARLASAEVGDVRDLTRLPDRQFEAVLCLGGPLSHLLDLADRCLAVSELVRVASPGAPVILSVIGYLGVLRTTLRDAPADLIKPVRQAVFSRGDHIYTGGYCDSHFFWPEELQELAEEAGLETVELRAMEGLSSNLPEATNALAQHDDGRWERWLEILDATRHDPAVVATSEHFLYVGRAPQVR